VFFLVSFCNSFHSVLRPFEDINHEREKKKSEKWRRRRDCESRGGRVEG